LTFPISRGVGTIAATSKWKAAGFALGLLLVGVLVFVVLRLQQPPEGVRPIIFDRESCAECGMSISDPRFAAQLQTAGGEVYDFDDPGCLLAFIQEHHPRVHAMYFHAFDASVWLTANEVGFVRGVQSPMGYGLAAVRKGTDSAMSLAEAEQYVRVKKKELRSGMPPAGGEER
jgi:copper chaperone NosL